MFLQCEGDRLLHQAVDLLVEGIRNAEGNDNVDDGVYEATAQFLEVFEETHAG